MRFYRDPAVGAVVTGVGAFGGFAGLGAVVSGPWAVVLFVVSAVFIAFSLVGAVLLILERWVGASTTVERLPLPTVMVPFLRKEGIEVAHRPDPQHWIHLYVRNNRGTDMFSAQITDVKGAERKQTVPWAAKWRGHKEEKREIVTGTEWPLDLAHVTPPVEEPSGIKGAWKRGEFRLFSVSEPNGWPVPAGPSEIIGPPEGIEWLGKERVYYEALTLRLEIARGRRKPVVKRVTLGFNPPFKAELREDNVLIITIVDNPIRVEIEDWA